MLTHTSKMTRVNPEQQKVNITFSLFLIESNWNRKGLTSFLQLYIGVKIFNNVAVQHCILMSDIVM